ncbi:hypothetical protein DPMN_105023 [Dreissena polymorpha]|uniref:Uncharacterized protein n=1 Tax=Dreissena polymorpha TaxID=45954 RepID=A0A9D4K368_DREPO|nr:hypothetical protein DPMN_105023 [Dreissena polymorpha]
MSPVRSLITSPVWSPVRSLITGPVTGHVTGPVMSPVRSLITGQQSSVRPATDNTRHRSRRRTRSSSLNYSPIRRRIHRLHQGLDTLFFVEQFSSSRLS